MAGLVFTNEVPLNEADPAVKQGLALGVVTRQQLAENKGINFLKQVNQKKLLTPEEEMEITDRLMKGEDVEQVANVVYGRLANAGVLQETKGIVKEFTDGFFAGVEDAKGLFSGVVAVAADAMGAEHLRDASIQDYLDITARTEKGELAPTVASIEDAWERSKLTDVGPLGRWGIATIGRQVPNFGAMLLSGGLGGLVGKYVAKRVITEQVGKKILQGFAGKMEKEALEKMAAEEIKGYAGKVVGSAAATAATGVTMGIGEAGGEQIQTLAGEGNEAAAIGEKMSSGAAIGFGGMAGLADSVLPSALLSKFGVPESAKQVFKRNIFKATIKGAATEGLTEAGQEALTVMAGRYVAEQDRPAFMSEVGSRMLNAFAGGALFGAPLGGAAEAFRSQPNIDPERDISITMSGEEPASAAENLAVAQAAYPQAEEGVKTIVQRGPGVSLEDAPKASPAITQPPIVRQGGGQVDLVTGQVIDPEFPPLVFPTAPPAPKPEGAIQDSGDLFTNLSNLAQGENKFKINVRPEGFVAMRSENLIDALKQWSRVNKGSKGAKFHIHLGEPPVGAEDAGAFVDRTGTINMVLQNIDAKTEIVPFLTKHETGHLVLREMLGDSTYGRLLTDVDRLMKDKVDQAEVLYRDKPGYTTRADFAEEVVNDYFAALPNLSPTGFKALLNRISRWFKNKLGIEMSEKDIAFQLHDVTQKFKRGDYTISEALKNYEDESEGNDIVRYSIQNNNIAQIKPENPQEQEILNRVIATNKRNPGSRVPELAIAANRLATGKINNDQFADYVEQLDPFKPKGFQQPATIAKIRQYMNQNENNLSKIGVRPLNNQPVEVRIDIPTFNNSVRKGDPTYAITLHDVGTNKKAGAPISYLPYARVSNPQFIARSKGGVVKPIDIAQGAAKDVLATVRGNFIESNVLPQDIHSWTEVSYNPVRSSEFRDVVTKQPVVGGQEALMVGSRVFVKAPQYGTKTNYGVGGDVRFSLAPHQSLFSPLIAKESNLAWYDRFITSSADRLHPINRLSQTAIANGMDGTNAYQFQRMANDSSRMMHLVGDQGNVAISFDQTDGQMRVEIERNTRGHNVMENDIIKKHGKAGLDSFYSHIAMLRYRASRIKDAYITNNLAAFERSESIARNDQAFFAPLVKEFDQRNKSVVRFFQQAGVISENTAKAWMENIHVPFYKDYRDDFNHDYEQPDPSKGYRGSAYKMTDIRDNVLFNWRYMYQTGLKNIANVETIKLARQMSIARPVTSGAGLTVMENGHPVKYGITDPDIFAALGGHKARFTSGFASWMLRAGKRLATYGVTVTPAFRIGNFIREAIVSPAMQGNMAGFVSGFRGLWMYVKNDPIIQEAIAAGAIGHGFQDYEGSALRERTKLEALADRLATRVEDYNPFKGVANFWHKVGVASENAHKLGYYASLREQGISQQDAAMSTRDLADYQLRGSNEYLQLMTTAIPFLNARIQGLRSLAVKGRENQNFMTAYATSMVAFTAAYWALTKDDDRYKALEQYDKNTYWHFWIGDEHFRVMKPFEFGAIFSTIPESALESTVGTEGGEYFGRQVFTMFKDTFSLNPIPAVIKPAAEVYFNKNTFTERQIVSERLKNLPPQEQFMPWTPTMYRGIADMFSPITGRTPIGNLSPVQLQHIFNGYTSGLAEFVAGGVSMFTDALYNVPEKPSGAMSPIVTKLASRLYTDANLENVNSRYITEYYKVLGEVQQASAAMAAVLKTGDREQGKIVYERYKNYLEFAPIAERINKQMNLFTRQQNAIWADRTLDGDQKQEAMDKVLARRQEFAKVLFDEWRKRN